MKRTLLFFVLIVSLASCHPTKNGKDTESTHQEIDFHIEDNRILLYANVNGIDSMLFLVDNGATRTLITSKSFEKFPIFDSKSMIKDPDYGLLSILPLHFKMKQYSFNLDTVAVCYDKCQRIDDNLVGILGVEIFMDQIIQFDFKREKMIILNSLPKNINDYEAIELHKDTTSSSYPSQKFRYILLSGFVDSNDDAIDGFFSLDLGSAVSIFTHNFSNKINLEKSSVQSQGLTSLICSMPSLQTSVYFMDDNDKSVTLIEDGYIGVDFLSQFNVIFDYPHNKLYLKPNKQ